MRAEKPLKPKIKISEFSITRWLLQDNYLVKRKNINNKKNKMRKTDKSSRTNKPPKISVNGGSIGTSKD